MPTSFTDVFAYVTLNASEEEVQRLFAALRDRQRSLQKVRAATVSVGDTVRIVNISPKGLVGLKAVVQSLGDTRATVEFTAESTKIARTRRLGRRVYIAPNAETYTTTIPLVCCEVL